MLSFTVQLAYSHKKNNEALDTLLTPPPKTNLILQNNNGRTLTHHRKISYSQVTKANSPWVSLKAESPNDYFHIKKPCLKQQNQFTTPHLSVSRNQKASCRYKFHSASWPTKVGHNPLQCQHSQKKDKITCAFNHVIEYQTTQEPIRWACLFLFSLWMKVSLLQGWGIPSNQKI